MTLAAWERRIVINGSNVICRCYRIYDGENSLLRDIENGMIKEVFQ